MSTNLQIAGIKNYRGRRIVLTTLLYIGLVALAVVCILPFWIMLVNATYNTASISKGIYFWFGPNIAENYRIMLGKVDPIQGFFNSLMITVPFVVLSGYFGGMTGYSLSKFKFRGHKLAFGLIVGTMMVPSQLGLIGYFFLCTKLGIINTWLPLILGGFTNAGTTFFMKMYCDTVVSDSLIEAARIDGSNEFRTFNSIIIPIIVPALATFSIFNFIAMWNNYIGPLVLISNEALQPLPVKIAKIRGLFEQNLGAIYLGVALSVLPIITAFVFLSKYIIGGITLGAIKE
jgi:multiple sugar transport system permease protein